MVKMIDRDAPRADDPDPWAGVLQEIRCGVCGFWIPAHLAERWAGLSVPEARLEWRNQYRDWPESHEADV
jgi:hypothetical protein